MNDYQEKHGSSAPWAIAGTASSGYRSRHGKKNKRRRRLTIFWVIFFMIILAWPFIEAHLLTTDRVNLRSDDLSADIGRLRVVFLSDIHYGYFYSDGELNALATRINQLKPDLVIFGGGYATDNLSAARFFERLPNIHARYAMLGVIGETDRGESDYELSHLQDVMRDAGVIPLVNEVSPVRVGASVIYVAGLDDPTVGTPDLKGVAASVSASDYVILVCHNPSVIPDTQLYTDSSGRLGWFDLGLFGHTHGGQLAIFPSLLGLAEDIPAHYRGGWLKENKADLLVSRGVGTSVFPIRLFCMPQIHDIVISVN